MMTNAFEYDVAVSFAEADKEIAKELTNLLHDRNIKVFLDEYKSLDAWGNDVLDHLVNLYARKACYCVLLISEGYPLKAWTDVERTSARESALRDADEYIFLIRLDDTYVPGIEEGKGYRDLRSDSLESIANELEERLAETQSRSGPPSQSHDLRSGNVPSTESTQGDETI